MLTITFSPDSRFVVGASFDGTAHILDANTGARIGAPLGSGNFEASYARWLPGGDAMALTSPRSKVIRVIDVATRRQIGPEYRPGAGLPLVTPDRTLLLSSSTSGDFRLFDVATGLQVGDIIQFKSQIGLVTMAPDGKAAVTNGAEGHIRWDIDPDSWKRKACELAGRNLTAEEWATYLPGEPYQRTCDQWPAPV
jgi:WD40 repeat protein